jgi:hypothetical protein
LIGSRSPSGSILIMGPTIDESMASSESHFRMRDVSAATMRRCRAGHRGNGKMLKASGCGSRVLRGLVRRANEPNGWRCQWYGLRMLTLRSEHFLLSASNPRWFRAGKLVQISKQFQIMPGDCSYVPVAAGFLCRL